MADEQAKAESSHTLYRQVNPAGIAPEVSAGRTVSQGATAAFGQWLHDLLGGGTEEEQRARRQHVASLSGLSAFDLGRLMEGQPVFPLDSDHIQRIASTLLEMRLITEPNAVWAAAGWGGAGEDDASDYIVPPSQIVRTMSGST